MSMSPSYPQPASFPAHSRQVLQRHLPLLQPFACKSHKNIFVIFGPFRTILPLEFLNLHFFIFINNHMSCLKKRYTYFLCLSVIQTMQLL
jgi:hypothetical protein